MPSAVKHRGLAFGSVSGVTFRPAKLRERREPVLKPPPPERQLCKDEADSLVAKWDGLATRAAKVWKHRNPDVPFEDICQAARLGLVMAGKCFDTTVGVQFQTYAQYHIDNQCRMSINRFRGHLPNCGNTRGTGINPRRFVSIREAAIRAGSTDGSDINADQDFVVQRENESVPEIPETIWKTVIEVVGYRAYTVLRMRADGSLLREIQDRIGVSRERVRQIEADSLSRLRESNLIKEHWLDV